MLVRLLTEYRRWLHTRSAGELLDLPDDEAAILIERGEAVPVTLAELERKAVETR